MQLITPQVAKAMAAIRDYKTALDFTKSLPRQDGLSVQELMDSKV